MNHNVPANKPVRRRGVTIAAAALSVALVAPFAQSVAYPDISATAQAQNPGVIKPNFKVTPPVFYANEKVGGPLTNTGQNAVRVTPSLVDVFFPEGTTFELQNKQWRFGRDGGVPAFRGPARAVVNDPERLQTLPNGTRFDDDAWPYVVPNTGQIVFALDGQAERYFGHRVEVPLIAKWTDKNTGREYEAEFSQAIQIGDASVQTAGSCGKNQEFVQPKNFGNEEFLGKFKVKTGRTGVANQGYYGGEQGKNGICINKDKVPKNQSFIFEPNYDGLTAGETESQKPKFHLEHESSTSVQPPQGTSYQKGDNPPKNIDYTVDPSTGKVTLNSPITKKQQCQ